MLTSLTIRHKSTLGKEILFSGPKLGGIVNTVNSPVTDTLVSGQLYLRTLFSILVFTSQSNSVFTRSLKMEIGFFPCLRSLVSGHCTFSLL